MGERKNVQRDLVSKTNMGGEEEAKPAETLIRTTSISRLRYAAFAFRRVAPELLRLCAFVLFRCLSGKRETVAVDTMTDGPREAGARCSAAK